jgi:predicted dehydrogenase
VLEALRFGCPLFIEKPVVANVADAELILNALCNSRVLTYVACNLRFHPAIKFLRNYLQINKLTVCEVNIYCGSDLSRWRPTQDYRNSYSAKVEMGGGVHLDLIHEIDYCYWLFGTPSEVKAFRRKVSTLEINSPDFASYQLIYPSFTANVILNYYRKTPKRVLEVVAEESIIEIDLLANTVILDGQIAMQAPFAMEETYLDQMQYFLEHLSAKVQPMNSFQEACEVLKIATHS